MLLDVDIAVLNTEDHAPVLNLLNMLAEERHDWRPELEDAIAVDDFVRRIGAARLSLPAVAEWATKAVVEAGQPRRLTQQPVRIGAADFYDAVKELNRSAVLVVENRIGDGGFIKAMAEALGDDRVVRALREGWLTFCHGGGSGQMPDLAAEECKGFWVLTPRVAILFDSDRERAGDPHKHEDKVVKARDAGVRHIHVFTWRMVENYVPFRVWEYHFPRATADLTRLRAMIPEERGYLHKKELFIWDDPPSRLIPEGLTLSEEDFHELGPDVVAELRRLLAMIHEIL